MLTLEVSAAVISRRNKRGVAEIFCARRCPGGEAGLKWEFPGGKLEQGETAEEALVREIKEEFGSVITADSFLTDAVYRYCSFYLIMHVYSCSLLSGLMIPREHIDSKWLSAGSTEFAGLDWAPADIQVAELVSRLFV